MPTQEHLNTHSLGDISFTGVLRKDLPIILPHVKKMLQDAVKTMNGRQSYEDLVRQLFDGQNQLWIAGIPGKIFACAVTEIVVYFQMKACYIRIVTADKASGHTRQHWQHFMSILENWAKAQGCSKMEANARKGWSRIMENEGWETTHYFIEKDLTNGRLIKTTDNKHSN
jgi:hypothetical protein